MMTDEEFRFIVNRVKFDIKRLVEASHGKPEWEFFAFVASERKEDIGFPGIINGRNSAIGGSASAEFVSDVIGHVLSRVIDKDATEKALAEMPAFVVIVPNTDPELGGTTDVRARAGTRGDARRVDGGAVVRVAGDRGHVPQGGQVSGTPILGMDPYLARIAKAQAAIQHLGDPGCLHSRHIVALFSVGTDAGGKLTHDIGLMLPRREELAVAMLLEVFVQLAKQRPTVFIGAMAKVKELNLGGTP